MYITMLETKDVGMDVILDKKVLGLYMDLVNAKDQTMRLAGAWTKTGRSKMAVDQNGGYITVVSNTGSVIWTYTILEQEVIDEDKGFGYEDQTDEEYEHDIVRDMFI